jgi:hypothetical protein
MEPLAAEPAMVARPSELQHSTCAACARRVHGAWCMVITMQRYMVTWCMVCKRCVPQCLTVHVRVTVHAWCTHLQVGGERGVRAAVARHDSVEHHVGHLDTCGCSLDTRGCSLGNT